MAKKLDPFCKLLKADAPITITQKWVENFELVNEALDDACKLPIKQPVPPPWQTTSTNDGRCFPVCRLQTFMMEDDPQQKNKP